MIIVDFFDKIKLPKKLSSGQTVVNFHGNKIIQTKRDDGGIFGGAYIKIGIKGTEITYASTTMSQEELIKYIAETTLYRFY